MTILPFSIKDEKELREACSYLKDVFNLSEKTSITIGTTFVDLGDVDVEIDGEDVDPYTRQEIRMFITGYIYGKKGSTS